MKIEAAITTESRKYFLVSLLLISCGMLRAQDMETLNKIQFANGLFKDGMYETARKQFAKISASSYPGVRFEAAFMEAECIFQLKNYPLAYEEFRKLYTGGAPQAVKKKSLMRMADCAYGMSQWGKAESLYGEYSRRYGDTPDALFYRAQSLSMLGKYSESEKYYLSLLEKYPGTGHRSQALYSAGYAFLKTGDYSFARKYFSMVPPGDLKAQSLFYEGVALTESGNYRAASGAFSVVSSSYPSSEWAKKALLKKAEILIAQKKYSDAEGLVKPLETNPGTAAWAAYLRGQSLYGEGSFTQAAVYYRAVADKYPKTDWAEKSLFSLGWSYLKLNDYLRARKSFAELILKYSRTSYFERAQLLIGHCYFYDKDYDKAAQAYSGMLKAFPLSSFADEAVFWRGLALMKTKHWSEASGLFEKIIKKFPGSDFLSRSYLNLGVCLDKTGKASDAVSVLKKGIAQSSGAASADDMRYALGGLYVRLGDYGKAGENYRAIRTPAKKPSAQLALGHAYVNAKKFAEARSQYARVMHLYPDSPEAAEAAFSVGLSFYKEKKWPEAVSHFADSAAKYPGTSWEDKSYYYAGWSAFAGKDWAGAADFWSMYYKKQPDAEILLHIGDSYYNAGKSSAAVSAYGKLIKDFPGSVYASQGLYSLALADRKRGDDRAAQAALERIEKEYPGSKIMPDSMFLLAEIYEGLKSYKDACKTFALIYEKYPSSKVSGDALYRASMVSLKMKDYASQRKYLRKLIEAFPKSAYAGEARYRICQTYFNEKNYKEAVSHSIRFKESSPSSPLAPAALGIAVKSLKALGSDARVEGLLRMIQKDYPSSEAAAGIYFKKGVELFGRKDYSAAVDELRKVTGILHDRSSAAAQKMIAECFLGMKQTEQARLEFLRVVYVYPDFPELVSESQYNIGLIYTMQDKNDKAAEAFKNVISKWPDSEWAARARRRLGELK